MKSPVEIEEGVILVTIEDQKTSCGINYIKKGSILKVARTKPEWKNTIKVFRNTVEEENNDWHSINLYKVRFATEAEEEMWNNEEYFI